MKKFLKISLIALGSLILLVVIAAGIVSWLVFTPARLTPIVNKQAAKYLDCQVSVGSADISVVKFFSRFELKVDGVTLVKPLEGAPCDTLLDVKSLAGRVDVMALLRRNELILSDLVLSDGRICIFVDAEGNANYDILPAPGDQPAETDEEEGGFSINYIDLGHVAMEGVSVRYLDLSQGMRAELDGLSADIKGTMRGGDADAAVSASLSSLVFTIDAGEEGTGSMDLSADRISADIRGKLRGTDADAVVKASMSGVVFAADSMSGNASLLEISGDAKKKGDIYGGDISAGLKGLLFSMAGEEYLRDADITLKTKAEAGMKPALSARFEELAVSLNGLALSIKGSVEMDHGQEGDILADIAYSLDSWPLADIETLIPSQYGHYLEDFGRLSGTLSSKGNIKGVYGKDSMPMLDLQVSLSDGATRYAALPFPVSGVKGDIVVHTDLKDDRTSYVRISNLHAVTPRSDISLSGELNSLFSDMRARVSAHGNISLEEMGPFIPDSLNITAAGRADLALDADVRMSHLEKMELEKIKASGSLTLTSLEASYDTISVSSGLAKIDFSLPAQALKDNNRNFASMDISADRLDVGMGSGIKASLEAPHIAAELGDIRDTTRIPAALLEASFEHINAVADTITAGIASPTVIFSVAPQRRAAGQPRFSLSFSGGATEGSMGTDTFGADRIDLNASVGYNEAESNPLLKFRPRGRLDATGIKASLQELGETVEVPVLEMGITPRQFVIDDMKVLFGRSDFHLDGILNNLVPFVQGDSVLRGDFAFKSDRIDLERIMALTSGLGGDDEEEQSAGFSGPYMVPKGVDVTLHATIKEALFEGESIRNIKGDVIVSDGNMVLEELTLKLPGADAQLTALYKTPRRNHLFAGIDFHLLDVEIETLLQMIPDLDSLMPMLRSFAGRAEFHMAVEANLDSLYRLKMSTLLGSASITGQDLVVMDSKTYRRIGRWLLFRDKKHNMIDSLSAEFTVVKDQIDVYPFLVSVDRYKAVIGGQHRLDMTFDYNISLVQSPLPFRLAVDIVKKPGDDKIRFKPFKRNKYPKFYRPASRGVVKNKQLELRQLIRQALVSSVAVKEDDEE